MMTALRLAFAALLLLAAAPSGTALAQAAPVVLHRGNGAEPDTLDPHKATGAWENNIIGDMLMGLFTDDPNGNPVYGAAVSHTVSEDGMVWTFKLRPGALWSDGVPVTAVDFVFALQRINTAATAAQYASLTHVVKNAAKVLAGELPPETIGARAIDAETLELTLEHPAPYLPQLLTHYTMFPVPKHAVETFGADWNNPGTYVSNGAFTLVEWRVNDFVHIAKNPRFWDAANVRIDQVFYFAQEDQNANVKRFRAGELDVVQGFPAQQIEFLKKEMPAQLTIEPQIVTWYVTINLTREKLKDVRARRAIGPAAVAACAGRTFAAAGAGCAAPAAGGSAGFSGWSHPPALRPSALCVQFYRCNRAVEAGSAMR